MLVTGAAGFLGRYVVERLEREGCEIVVLVRPSTDLRPLRDFRVTYIHGDIREPEALDKAMREVDAVVHAAAILNGPWDDFHAVNVESTRALLEAARRHGVRRFVYISSVSVYDHVDAEPGHVFTEEQPYQTEELNFYARSKIEAEKVVREYGESHGAPTVILRPGALYGPGGPIFPAQLGIPLGENAHLLFGKGDTAMLLCHVRSVAEAVWLALNRDEAVGGVYNLVEDEQVTRLEYLKHLKQVGHPTLKIIRVPYFLGKALSQSFKLLFGLLGKAGPLRPLYLKTTTATFYYATDRAKSELGWQPAVNLHESLDAWFAAYRKAHEPRRQVPMVKGKIDIPSKGSLHVGIVGCGEIAAVHLAALQKIPNVRVVAVADPSPEAREALAEKFGLEKTYASLTDMLAAERVDAVHVLAPAQYHAALSIEAMRHGCHVLVEKPMALTLREAEEMVAVALEKNVKLCVGHNHLFDAATIRAREILAGGALGRIAYVESWYGVALSSDGGNRALRFEARDQWFYRMPGGLYQDFISHPISLLTDVMGEAHPAKSVAKYVRVVPYMASDELRVLLENDETIGSLCISLAVSPRYQFLKIYGTRATLTVDILNKYVFLDSAGGPLPKTLKRNLSNLRYGWRLLTVGVRNLLGFLLGRFDLFEGTERMIRLFYRSVLLGEPVPVSPEEGLQSMRIMEEIWSQLGGANGRSDATEAPGAEKSGGLSAPKSRKKADARTKKS